jgi:hypothetical protein
MTCVYVYIGKERAQSRGHVEAESSNYLHLCEITQRYPSHSHTATPLCAHAVTQAPTKEGRVKDDVRTASYVIEARLPSTFTSSPAPHCVAIAHNGCRSPGNWQSDIHPIH